MSTEQNKATMQRFVNLTDDKKILQLLHPDFVANQPNGTQNREAFLQHMNYFNTVFSDTFFTIEGQVAEGDRVVTYGKWSGTHTSDFQGVPPTGKQIAISAVLIDRFEDGKIVEHRGQFDMFSMMQQLDLVPSS